MLMETASLVAGQAIPYATLVYAWDGRRPPGTVVPHAVTQQIKTVVVGHGFKPPPGWQRVRRDDVADCRRAFVTPPGPLVGIGILTDSDNTGSEVVAYDGDIRLRPAPSEDVAADTSGDTRTR